MTRGVCEIEHPQWHRLIKYDERCANAHSPVVYNTIADTLNDACPAALSERAKLFSSEEKQLLINAFSQRTYPIV